MKKSNPVITQAEKLYYAACAERQVAVNKAFHDKEDRELAAQANYHIGVVSGMQHMLEILQINVLETPLEFEFVKWDDSYRNGFELFDNQHKDLFNLVRHLHRGILEGKTDETLGMALTGLMGSINAHFTNEENVMLTTNYPGFNQHKNKHDDFIMHVYDANGRFLKGDAVVTMELVSFLMQWLRNHIQTVDRAYGPHLKANGIS